MNWGDQALLPSQRNHLFTAIETAGLSPADFEIVPKYNPNVEAIEMPPPRLVYRPGGHASGYYFEVDPRGPDRFEIEMSPGGQVVVEEYEVGSWPSAVELAKAWLSHLNEEINQPDLWAGVLDSPPSLAGEPAVNDPLTPEEVAWVRQQVGTAKQYVAGLGLPQARLVEVSAKLDYLVEASERMGRFDWRQVAAGIAVNVAISAAFNPEQARTIFQLLAGPIQRLLGG